MGGSATLIIENLRARDMGSYEALVGFTPLRLQLNIVCQL